MKVITLKEFTANAAKYTAYAASGEEIYRIGFGKKKAVLMEEAEYNILREALATLLSQK